MAGTPQAPEAPPSCINIRQCILLVPLPVTIVKENVINIITKSTAHSRRKTNVLSFDKRCVGYFLGLAKAIDVNLPSSNIA